MVILAWYMLLGFFTLLSLVYSMIAIPPFNQTQAFKRSKKAYLEPAAVELSVALTTLLIALAKIYLKVRKASILTNIKYMGQYAVIDVQDTVMKRKLYIPYRRGLKVSTRYRACVYKDGARLVDITSLPGIPALVKASELGGDEICYVTPAKSRVVKKFLAEERPVIKLLDSQIK